MNENIDSRRDAQNEETVVKEIATEIVNDLILEFCFEIHRALKLGYIESYFASESYKPHQDSKSYEGNFLESKLQDLNKSVNRGYQVSDQRETIYPKQMNGLEITAGCSVPLETVISVKGMNLMNSFSFKSEDSVKVFHCLEQSDKAKENVMKLSVMKYSLPENVKCNDYNVNNFNNIMHIPRLNLQESKIFCQVMNGSVPLQNDPALNLDARKFNKDLKLSAEGVKQVLSLAHFNELSKSLESQRYEKLLKREKEWIKEAHHCPGCKNSNSFKDWMQFIASPQTKESNTMEERDRKQILGEKETKCYVLSEKKEQVYTDVFGNPEKSLRKSIYKKICTCTICQRKIGAVRFAYHLGSCLGLGRRRSQRIHTNTKRNKR